MAPKIKAKYIGDGPFVGGIPARDLSTKEWNSLTKEQQDTAIITRTHKLVTAPKPRSDGESQ